MQAVLLLTENGAHPKNRDLLAGLSLVIVSSLECHEMVGMQVQLSTLLGLNMGNWIDCVLTTIWK